MKVESILPAARMRLVTVKDSAQLTQAAAQLGRDDINLIVVCNDSGAMTGVVSKTDIVSRISVCEGCGCTEMVANVMTRDVVCCHPGDPLHKVWSLIKEKGVLQVPVVDQDRHPIGVLAVRDALQALLKETEYEEKLLRDYVMGIGYH